MAGLSKDTAIRIFDDETLAERFGEVFEKAGDLDPDGQDFEIVITESLVKCEDRLDGSQADKLHSTVRRLSSFSEKVELLPLLIVFYAAFEWPNRCVTDRNVRLAKWREIFRHCSLDFSGYALFHYAKSRYHYENKEYDKAIDEAREATRINPTNIGWLNNYTEILLERLENALLSQEDLTNARFSDEELSDLLGRFDKAEGAGAAMRPDFFQSKGRICAYMGEAQAAREHFDAAKALALELRRSGHGSMAEPGAYVSKVSEIIQSQTVSEIIQVSRMASDAMRKMEQGQRENAKLLDDRVAEVSNQLSNDRVSMLEFLGFFSGIVSFIIASITIGDELGFIERSMLILVLLGTLLIAFGSLGFLLEGMRPEVGKGMRSRNRGRIYGMIAVGFWVLILGFVFYLVACTVGVS